MDKIKILVIPPYVGMVNIFTKIVAEHDNVVIQLYDGSQNHMDRNIAQYVKAQKTDIIISWGDTALLEQAVDIPIVKLMFTSGDILRTLKMLENAGGKKALVGYSIPECYNLEEYTRTICEILGYRVDYFNVADGSAIDDLFNELADQKYSIIIGSKETVDMAPRYGLNGVQLTYGNESVRNAVDKAVLLWESLQKNNRQQHFYRELLDGCSDYLIVQNADGKIIYNNTGKGFTALLNSFRENSGSLESDGYVEITSGGVVWSITQRKLKGYRNNSMTAIYFRKLRFVDSTGGGAISYMNSSPSTILTRFYSDTNCVHNIMEQIDNFSHIKKSVLISGERGLGKEDLAYMLHGNGPVIRIDCNNLTVDSLSNFIEKSIYDMQGKEHAALLIANADIIAPGLQEKLADLLENISKQNDIRIIATAWDEIFKKVARGAFSDRLYHLISQVCISVPPLRDYIKQIDAAIGFVISFLNVDLGTQVVGLRPDAMECLKEYRWEGNIQQLIDVLRRLLLVSRTAYITAEDLEKILAAEDNIWSSRGESVFWKGTLDEITKRIIKAVLVDEGMNQTKAAKRLGISRSTMWKKIK